MRHLLAALLTLSPVVAHAQPSYARPRAEIPQGVAFNDNASGFGGGGPSFLERLFGGPPAPPPAPTRRPSRNVFTR